MAQLDDLAERVDRLVVRHQELKRTSGLIAQQLVAVTNERDNLRARLAAARARIETLISRLPASELLPPDSEFGAHGFDGSEAPSPAAAPGSATDVANALGSSQSAGLSPFQAQRGEALR